MFPEVNQPPHIYKIKQIWCQASVLEINNFHPFCLIFFNVCVWEGRLTSGDLWKHLFLFFNLKNYNETNKTFCCSKGAQLIDAIFCCNFVNVGWVVDLRRPLQTFSAVFKMMAAQRKIGAAQALDANFA